MEKPGNPHWPDGHSNLSRLILKKAWLWKGRRQGDMCSTRKYNLKKFLKSNGAKLCFRKRQK